jgi:glycosyltransferase involved in cell wall biosynthesis
LQKLDHDNHYTILLKPRDLGGWQASNPNFEAVACRFKEFTFGEQLGLRRQISGLEADLAHFPFAQQPVWYRGRTVTTIQDLTTLRFDNPAKNRLVFRLKQQVYKYVIKRAVRKAARVITPSRFVKDDLVKFAGTPPDKITVTHEAAEAITDTARPLPELDGKRFLMYVGRPTPHKNLERLIEAFGRLRTQHPDLLLVLAGKKDANYQRIEQAVQKANKQGIVFTGFVSEGQLRWLYEHCAAYVFPSLSEGFGLPGLEAMAHGAPVVSSNATCLPEVYGEAAHYFDPLNVQAMTSAIDHVLTDENLRQKLIKDGRAWAAKYSWQQTAKQTLAIYENVLD